MMLLRTDQIWIEETRQRTKEAPTDELQLSLQKIGLINPITVTREPKWGKEYKLIAGYRRFSSAGRIGWEEIEARLFEDLTPAQQSLIELEENIKRAALHWKDECRAVLKYHTLLQKIYGEDWTQEATANAAGFSQPYVAHRLMVARELQNGNSRVHAADSFTAARGFISRSNDRAIQSEIDSMDFDGVWGGEAEPEAEEDVAEPAAPTPKSTTIRPANQDLIVADFLEQCQTYSGPRFNFLHCDFPYGIQINKSDQGQADMWESYEDTPEVYFKLLAALTENLDRFLYPSAHIMFWFSMKHYSATRQMFNNVAGLRVETFPLIWHKSDGRGILPDPERGPRRTYETALLISRGDRRIVRSVAASYAGATARSEGGHMSHKPEPVLRHFFQMFVDEVAEVLDPTCGSGSALNVAEELGARRVAGWDLSAEHISNARSRLERGRRLRLAESVL